MRTHAALLVLAVADVLSVHEAPPAAASLRWANVTSSYRSLEEIKPTLVNTGKVSVYLSRLWPDGSAQLERFNKTSGEWEKGSWGITCGTVAEATIPIEIKPNSQQPIHVYWQLSMDKWEKPEHFVVFGSMEQRPLAGRYRFRLRYSLQPWTLVHRPSAVYSLVSPEFALTPG